MKKSLELRLKLVKNLGNLRMEYLKRFYDRSSIIKRYIKGDISIHIHGIVFGMTANSEKYCLTFFNRVNNNRSFADSFHRQGTRWSDDSQGSMLVWVGDTFESARPLATEARLEKLDSCLVNGGKPPQVTAPIRDDNTFKLPFSAVHPSLPVRLGMFDRKLCVFLNLSRIQNSKFIDQIIKSSPKVVYSLPDKNGELMGNDISAVLQSDDSSNLWVYVPSRWAESTPENCHFSFEPFQVLLCPTYSLISAIQRMHMLYLFL